MGIAGLFGMYPNYSFLFSWFCGEQLDEFNLICSYPVMKGHAVVARLSWFLVYSIWDSLQLSKHLVNMYSSIYGFLYSPCSLYQMLMI